jgi:hypothetical protein
MAETCFPSVPCTRPVWRTPRVRQCWVIRPFDAAQPFDARAEIETVKMRAGVVAAAKAAQR